MRGVCANCGRERRMQARGLCVPCHKTPEVRVRFTCGKRGRPKLHKEPRPRAIYAVPHAGKVCRHCGAGTVCRPRGLCTPCYDDSDIREKYPTTGSKYGRRSDAAFVTTTAAASVPDRMTWAPPGTAHKIAVMAERVRLKKSPFHPDDAKT